MHRRKSLKSFSLALRIICGIGSMSSSALAAPSASVTATRPEGGLAPELPSVERLRVILPSLPLSDRQWATMFAAVRPSSPQETAVLQADFIQPNLQILQQGATAGVEGDIHAVKLERANTQKRAAGIALLSDATVLALAASARRVATVEQETAAQGELKELENPELRQNLGPEAILNIQSVAQLLRRAATGPILARVHHPK